MSEVSVQEIVRSFTRASCTSPDRELLETLLHMLLDAGPVSIARIAERTGMAAEDVRAALARLPDTEFDHAGRVIGHGLSLRPTRHQFRVDGRTLYTWCAWDALELPALLGRSADVESRCPVSGASIRMRVTPDAVSEVAPADGAISLVPRTGADPCCAVRANFCDYVHFFRSAREAEDWLDDRRPGLVISIEEAFELVRNLR